MNKFYYYYPQQINHNIYFGCSLLYFIGKRIRSFSNRLAIVHRSSHLDAYTLHNALLDSSNFCKDIDL